MSKMNTFYTIAKTIERLEKLRTPAGQITDKSVIALSKMHHLNEIYFYDSNNISDSSVKLPKNMQKLR